MWRVIPRSWMLWAGAWLWVVTTGVILQFVVLPATSWHAGNGLLAGGDWVMFQAQARELAEAVRQQGWDQWQLRYEGQAPASLAAALYALTGVEEPWVLLPVHGVLYALALWATMSMATALGVKGRAQWLVVLPFAFPSAVLIYAQLHKDILSLPGVALIAWAWVRAVQVHRMSWQSIRSVMVAAAVGTLLVWWPRPYQAQIVLGLTTLMWLGALAIAWRTRRREVAALATMMTLTMGLVYVTAEKAAAPAAPAAPVCQTWTPEFRIPVLDRPVATLFCYRHSFIQYHQANGNIDTQHWLTNYAEALAYLPRCQVPDDCIDPRRRALFIGRETMRELIEELRRQKS